MPELLGLGVVSCSCFYFKGGEAMCQFRTVYCFPLKSIKAKGGDGFSTT